MKKKKRISIIGVLLILLVIIGLTLFILNREEKTHIKNIYTIYLNMDSLVKVDYQEEYFECKKGKKVYVCSDITNKIIGYEFLVNKNEDTIKEINLNKKSIKDFIVSYLDALSENDKELPDIIITSNYNLKDNLLKNTSYEDKVKIKVVYNKEIDENSIISEYEGDIKYYTITFDTDGGTPIDSVVVKDGELLEKPETPKKENFKFIEWQLDSNEYDFKTPVKSNLTLKSKWQKIENKVNEAAKPNNSNSSNSNVASSTSSKATNTKINLNDRIIVRENITTILCGFGVFASNLKEVFPAWDGKSYCPFSDETCLPNEISEILIDTNASSIKFDISKENNLKNILDSGKTLTNGIKTFDYSVENHKIKYNLESIEILDGSYTTDGMNLNKKIKSATSSIVKFYGPCGGMNPGNEILNERLCDLYHLDCGRW